jgi:hypothetical protein
MVHSDQNAIPVTFINLFMRRQLAQAVLPALPVAGDDVYVLGRGYEVVNHEWTIQEGGRVEIVIVVRPQIDADGERPFSYDEEEAE